MMKRSRKRSVKKNINYEFSVLLRWKKKSRSIILKKKITGMIFDLIIVLLHLNGNLINNCLHFS